MNPETLPNVVKEFLQARGCSVSEDGALSAVESLDFFALLSFAEATFQTTIDIGEFYAEGVPEHETLTSLSDRLIRSQMVNI